MDESHSDSKDHRWFQNRWNRTFIIRECLKELRCIFLGHVGRRNTSSGQKYPLILYVKPSNKGIITLLFFQFQLRERLFKVWNYIENHTREFKSDSFDFEIARLISDHNVPQSVQLSLHTIPDTCYSYHSQGHVQRETALNDTGHLPQNLLPVVYSKFSAYSISMRALHFAATAACRGSIHDTLAYGYSRNYVYPQTLGRICQQVCFLNKIQCKMQLVTIFGFGKATTGRK